MKKHRGLGRGLDALIPNTAEEESRDKEGSSETGKEETNAEHPIRKKNIRNTERQESVETSGIVGRAVTYNIEETALDSNKNSRISVGDEPAERANEMVRMVRISMVEPDRNQPRKNFDKEKLQELADSIKTKGLLEPIIVQDKGGHY